MCAMHACCVGAQNAIVCISAMLACVCRSVSATYQWGGVARVDVVSAPFGTALAFYGPPALHVHALPLVSQHDVVQSAAALATQHDTRQHSTAQRDEGQHGKAQHAAEPAQEAAVAADDDSNDHSLSPDQPSMSDLKLDVHEALPNSHQTPIASHSLDGRQRTSSAHVPQLQQQHRHVQPPAADSSHDFTTPARAADSVSESAEEGMEEDEGLFAEASVISRGGLKMVEKVICPDFPMCSGCCRAMSHDTKLLPSIAECTRQHGVW